MAGIALPSWHYLKSNIQSILTAISTEEAAIDPHRAFLVTRDRWRGWVESQQNIALVNILADSVEPSGGGSHHYQQDRVVVNIDMYAFGTYEEKTGSLLPADEVAAARLDLLIAQVREGLTRKNNIDLGFNPGRLSRESLALQFWSQEREDTLGQYAPARWVLTVQCPYVPTDQDLPRLEEINLMFEQTLEAWGLKIAYPQDDGEDSGETGETEA